MRWRLFLHNFYYHLSHYNYTSLVTMTYPNNEILSKTTLLWIGVGAAGGAGVALGAQGVANIAQVDICFKRTITH